MVRFASAVLIAALATATVGTGPALAADGAQLFATTCKICHQGASSPLAPSLNGVAGRKMGSLTDFTYSAGLKAKGGVWTDANLDTWLKGPGAMVPGAKMVINVPDAANRAAIIAYLHTLK